jgi:hypothetical protein
METELIEEEIPTTDPPEVEEDAKNEAPYEPPKRGVGRPPKNPNKIAVTLPKPPAFQIKKPQTFVEYWECLNKVQAATCLVRVYRLWPVINNKQLKPDSNNDIDTIIGEDCFFGAPDEWEDALLHRYGSGWYQLYLNQEKSCICRCVMKTRQDLVNHPPKITSGTLVEGHPDNAGYVQYLRDRGLYKDERIEAEQMQSSEAINKLTDTVISMANRQSIPVPQPPSQNNDRVISELVRPMMSMMEKANESAIETVKAQHSGNDPLATLASVGALLKDLRGGNGDGDSGIKTMLEATMKQNSMLLEKLLTRETAPPVSPMVAIKETLDIINSMREAAGGGKSDGDGESNPKQTFAQTLVESLPTVLPPVLGLIDRGMAMFQMMRAPAASQLQQPHPPAQQNGPPNPYGQPQTIQQAMKQEEQRQAAGGTGAPPTQAPQASEPVAPVVDMRQYTPEQIAQEEKARQQYAQFAPFLSAMAPAIVSHLNDQGETDPETGQLVRKNGYDFADWVISGYQRISYDQIKAVGPDMLLGAIKSYPPLWQQIGGIEARVQQFIGEFMTYDEFMAQQNNEGDENDND